MAAAPRTISNARCRDPLTKTFNAMIDQDAISVFRDGYNLLVVMGPTASGKTGLAVRLARRIGGEIISADSRQVYIGMDLGTGKDLSAYRLGGPAVPVHLIDIIPPAEEFSVFDYQERFYRCFQETAGRGKIPILAGGTGLYLDAVVRGYRLPAAPENRALREELAGQEMAVLRRRLSALRPAAHNTTDFRERKRLIRAIEIAEFIRAHPGEAEASVRIVPLVIGIRCRREDLRRKITERLVSRLEAGMVGEVRRLCAAGVPWERLESFGLEYRYIALYLQGKITESEMFQTLNTRIHQFAKRQETWFRGMERKGVRINWIEGADEAAALALIAGRTA